MNYFLWYFVYRPLRRWLPKPAAMLATFLISGLLLHDFLAGDAFSSPYIPRGPILFGAFGMLVIFTDFFNLRWHGTSAWVRVALNVSCLILGFALRFAIMALIRP